MTGSIPFRRFATSCGVVALLVSCGGSTSPPRSARADNHPPEIRRERIDTFVAVGEKFEVEAPAFTDPDGDALTYRVTTRGSPGMVVDGRRVSGTFATPGAVEVTVTGRDPAGASAQYVFMVAAAAPEPGAPKLDATFVYRDDALPLPDAYRISSHGSAPLWDAQAAGNLTTDAGAALGRVLFHDRRLSLTNTHACASCHQREHGFASAERFSTGVLGVPLTRNTMALANVRYNIHGSWLSDLRVNTLRDAASNALTRTDEMGVTLPEVETRLRATPFYGALFQAAFGSPEITADRALRALEQYLQAMLSYRSRFDAQCATVGGFDPLCDLALTPEENRGREIFFAKDEGDIACTQCHQMPGGSNIWMANTGLDAGVRDAGAGNGRFRAASLYNIALTAPYMHDGRLATLREVIDHYDHGIAASRDLDPLLRAPDGSARRLHLAEPDKRALEAFLHTLTDRDMLADPKFSDPFR